MFAAAGLWSLSPRLGEALRWASRLRERTATVAHKMYTEYYGLSAPPFKLTPDDRYFFASRPHRKALAYLNYGLSKGEGFVVITGEIGAGKTTALAHLRSSLSDPRLVMAWLTTTQVAAEDLLRLIAGAFGLPSDGSTVDKATLLRSLETFFRRCSDEGKKACIIIDEAQSLRTESLEELRMLSNFHSHGRSLVQIFLVGQPEFRKTILSPDLEQLRQRVVVAFHLSPLDSDDTRKYIEHRLKVAGWNGEPIFADGVFGPIYAQSSGVPRKINQLCDRLLLYGCLAERTLLTEADASEVIREMEEELPVPATRASAPPPALALDEPGGERYPQPGGATSSLAPQGEAQGEPLVRDDRHPRWAPWTDADDEAEKARYSERRPRGRLLLITMLVLAVGLAVMAYALLHAPSPVSPPPPLRKSTEKTH